MNHFKESYMKYCREFLLVHLRRDPTWVILDQDDYKKYKLFSGYKDPNGYVVVYYCGKQTYLHRLITNFVWDLVDHKNQIKHDCRKENLREATRYLNGSNVYTPVHNTSGNKNVTWNKANNRWLVRISHKGKRIYIGSFIEKAKAISKAKEAEEFYTH